MAGWSVGAGRSAEALVRAGGVTVRLRVPGLPASGDDGEQLGLATPAFTDVELGRGVFRKANSTRVLLLPASVVDRAGGAAPAGAMFAGAAGVVIGETLYVVEACDAMRAGDAVYAYALTLAAAL